MTDLEVGSKAWFALQNSKDSVAKKNVAALVESGATRVLGEELVADTRVFFLPRAGDKWSHRDRLVSRIAPATITLVSLLGWEDGDPLAYISAGTFVYAGADVLERHVRRSVAARHSTEELDERQDQIRANLRTMVGRRTSWAGRFGTNGTTLYDQVTALIDVSTNNRPLFIRRGVITEKAQEIARRQHTYRLGQVTALLS